MPSARNLCSATDIKRPFFARTYPKAAARADRRGATEHRRRLLAGLSGRVVELGAGNGLNFAHYPDTVTEVVAIEPEPGLRAAAEQVAQRAGGTVTVRAGTADRLPLTEGEMDASVTSLVLCSVTDQARALAELHRVLRPGGELRFYKHVIARCQPKRTILQLVDRSGLWPAIAGGCHPARDTGAAIEAAGFTIERSERFGFSAGPIEPSGPTSSGSRGGPDRR